MNLIPKCMNRDTPGAAILQAVSLDVDWQVDLSNYNDAKQCLIQKTCLIANLAGAMLY